MASQINASNSGFGGIVSTGDSSGVLELQTTGTTAVTIDTSQRVGFVAGTAAAPAITRTGDTNTGMFFPAADTIAFAEGGTEAMRLDASGNLLVGTSTTGSTGINLLASYNLGWGQGSGESVPNIFRQTSSAATVMANGYRHSTTANGFASSFSSSFAKSAISLNEGTMRFYTDTAAAVAAGTDVTPSERMRIDSSGNLLLGTTTPLQSSPYPNHSIQIKSSDFPQISYQNSSAATSGSFWLSGQSSNDYWYLLPQPQNKGVYLTYTSTTGWSSFSDETLKENLVPIENALNKINTLRTVTGNFIDDPDTPHVFLIAQDVQAILPEAVHMNLDHNVLGMNYNEIIPLLTAGIKELKTENDTLKTQLSDLKARVTALEAK